MVERSMFESNHEIIEWVKEHYELGIHSVELNDVGSANCYILKSDQKMYFMKEFQSKINQSNLLTEIEVCEFLRKKGLPVSEFVKNVQGEYISSYKEKCIHIQEYIHGDAYAMYELPEELLYLSGRYLGKINRYMKELEGFDLSFDDEWLSNWSNEEEIAKIEELLQERHEEIDDSIARKIEEDFEFKISVLKGMEGYANKFIGSYRCNSHGDYSLLQLLFEGKQIKAIVDFAAVCCLPPTWEIIRSYTYAASECRDGNCIDYNKFKKYLDEYLRENDIPAKDIILMPSFYFFQLIRSTFGYKQFLKENIDSNLDFAFWRTKMCKWLYDHLQEFEEFLRENYQNIDLIGIL